MAADAVEIVLSDGATHLMKRAHRKSHFFLWVVLAPIIFCITLLAVMYRPGAPVNDALPDALSEETG